MHNDDAPSSNRMVYLLKVLAGLLAVCLLVLSALWLPLLSTSPPLRYAALLLLLGLALALIPVAFAVYRRRDELQRLQHQQASANTIVVLASVAAVVGILQANQWMPLFNQFWSLGLLLAVWGVQLVSADHRFR